jgi:hypothetical protein
MAKFRASELGECYINKGALVGRPENRKKSKFFLAGAQLWTPIFTPHVFCVKTEPNNTACLL